MIKIDPDSYYRESDVADLFGFGIDKVRRDRQTGMGPRYCKYGRQAYYLGADLIAHLAKGARASTSDNGIPRLGVVGKICR